ncbi:SDR family NAD(P)-dependent oxidoreductase [Colwellia demingiae]|uniref:SDR family NAD(P)-dependent oxidoreductase n=1 Tax=Colwellia demingiae TaxID=89401 RepID=A0A5C6Q5V3_9GAMM|nr:SDR family NAD(P)-dependent oxidoreductase [Colwellia demingiae]TWX64305.1 SDR family NAD(P)-dependent oxidoreductase [Colwellia demingiae]
MKIEGSVAVITGGVSGLGRATLACFVAQGCKVIALDMNDELGAEVSAEYGDMVLYHKTNVTLEDDVKQALANGIKKFGRIDICVNCAGNGDAGKTYSRRNGLMPLETFKRIVDVNLIGSFNVARLCVEQMVKNEPNDDNEKGVIINTASVAAFEGQIGQVPYAASKAGIVGMTLTLARDLSSLGIRVNTIAPGLIDTPMLARLSDDVRHTLEQSVLCPKRLGQPSEFAGAVQFLVNNGYMNGEVIRMDGGIRMQPK